MTAQAKLYADRDPRELEPHYSNHVMAMTAEGLHSKADIAAELAWRDAEIQALRKALGALLPEVEAEIEQRKHSGNAEYWQPLQEMADQGRAAMEQKK